MLSRPERRRLATAIAVALVLALGASAYEWNQARVQLRSRAEAITGGSADRGLALFEAKGCGGCHSLSGVPQAQGKVGPPLDGIGTRAVVGGRLGNKPGNLMLWLMHPQQVNPGTAMPELGLTDAQARDLAAFLYTRS